MRFYSPFIDENENMLLPHEIKFSHLSHLLDIEEGYKVEYKSLWNIDVKKKHLAKTISSFANTEGGWLFIGVNNDGSVAPISNERTDFGQQISEIVKSTISPHPVYETIFIQHPDDKDKGVLAIYVHEGREPPYICNGTVYLRVGSSKEPVPASHRAEVDYLISKRSVFSKQLDKFCVDDILDNDTFPYCVVYIYNSHPTKRMSMGDETIQDEIRNIASKYRFESWMPSASSILFYNSKNVSTTSLTTIFELFFDYSFKFHVPLTLVPNDLANRVSQDINKRNTTIDITDFLAIDGFFSYCGIKSFFEAMFKILLEKDIALDNYIVKAQLNNIKNSYLFFATKDYKWHDFMCQEGFRYSPKDSISPLIINPINLSKDSSDTTSGVYSFLCLSLPFGYMMEDFFYFADLNTSVANAAFPDGKYSNHEYYGKVFGVWY